jgi:hypothetical protein
MSCCYAGLPLTRLQISHRIRDKAFVTRATNGSDTSCKKALCPLGVGARNGREGCAVADLVNAALVLLAGYGALV